MSVVEVLHLNAGDARRGLSSRTLPSLETFGELVADIEALRRGLPLPDHHGGASSEARDDYDDRLDAELDALD